MDALRLLRPFALAALAVALVAPAASAHTSVFTSDGKVRAVIGQLNEPVSTYAVSGLDVCFQQNNTARTPIPTASINAGGLTAVLRAPNGAELKQDLRSQFGRAGCFSFSEPYVLTVPGQYVVDLSGSVNGSAIDVKNVNAGGAVVDRSNITFPDSEVASDVELQQKVAALEARVATLEAGHDGDKKSPAPVAAWMMVGLAALAAARRLR